MQGSVPQNAHHTTAWYSYVKFLTNFPPFGEIMSDRSCGCWLLPIHGCFRCQSVAAMQPTLDQVDTALIAESLY